MASNTKATMLCMDEAMCWTLLVVPSNHAAVNGSSCSRPSLVRLLWSTIPVGRDMVRLNAGIRKSLPSATDCEMLHYLSFSHPPGCCVRATVTARHRTRSPCRDSCRCTNHNLGLDLLGISNAETVLLTVSVTMTSIPVE